MSGSQMATLFTSEKFQVVGPNGPIPGAQVFTYAAGTLTPKATYTDQAGASQNANPVITGADGRASIWLGDGAYRFRIFNSLAGGGALIDDVDNVSRYVTAGDLSAVTASVSGLQTQLADDTLIARGAGMVGYGGALNYAADTAGWALRSAGGLVNALRYIPVSEWAGILNGTTTTDLTAYIQAGIDAEGGLYFPRGKWPISASTGIILRNGAHIAGAGKNQTIFWGILGTGGSVAQIASYSAGSIFRRQFNVAPGTNQYVSGVLIADVGIILNHPTASITTSAIQVAIDFRNISRSDIERVHVGNFAPGGSFVAKTDPPYGFAQQGYGILFGNVPAGATSYAGGEVNNIRSSGVWGAYKLIALDEATLSPSSAALGCTVVTSDLQGGHHGLVQESQYTAGCTFGFNVIQNSVHQNGDLSPTYLFSMNGYNNVFMDGYIEAGPSATYMVYLGSASNNNRVRLTYFDATSLAAITDLGLYNTVETYKNTSMTGGVTSDGTLSLTFNKAPLNGTYCGFWNGATFTVIASNGITITRNGIGDYFLNVDVAQPNVNWIPNVMIDVDGASGHSGTVVFQAGTQSATRIRFRTYSQIGAVTNPFDPTMLYASFMQAV